MCAPDELFAIAVLLETLQGRALHRLGRGVKHFSFGCYLLITACRSLALASVGAIEVFAKH